MHLRSVRCNTTIILLQLQYIMWWMIIIIFRQSRIVVASTTTLYYVKCLKYNNKACGSARSLTQKNTKSPVKTGSHYTNFDQQVILINHWTWLELIIIRRRCETISFRVYTLHVCMVTYEQYTFMCDDDWAPWVLFSACLSRMNFVVHWISVWNG